MGRIWPFLVLAVVLLNSIFAGGEPLVELNTGECPTDLHLEFSLFQILLEPFTGPGNMLMHCSLPQLAAWVAWVLIAYVIWRSSRFFRDLTTQTTSVRSRIFRELLVPLGLFTLALSYFILLLTVPHPTYRLVSDNPEYPIIDYHSHTVCSHDSFTTPEKTIKRHKAWGFNSQVLTDHTTCLCVADTARAGGSDYYVVGGSELGAKEEHWLFLGVNRELRAYGLKDTADIIRFVDRSERGLAAGIHYQRLEPAQLLARGADAFYVAEQSLREQHYLYRNAERLVTFARQHDVPILGGTNDHGWGFSPLVWNVVSSPIVGLTQDGFASRLVEVLGEDGLGFDANRVVLYRRNRPATTAAITISPLGDLLVYFSGLRLSQVLSWFFWTALVLFVTPRVRKLLTQRWILILSMAAWAVFIIPSALLAKKKMSESRKKTFQMFYKHGVQCEAAGDLNHALQDYRLTLRSMPELEDTFERLWRVALEQDRPNTLIWAITQTQRALPVPSDRPRIRWAVARALMDQGNLKDAASLYREFLETKEYEIAARYHLAVIKARGKPNKEERKQFASLYERNQECLSCGLEGDPESLDLVWAETDDDGSRLPLIAVYSLPSDSGRTLLNLRHTDPGPTRIDIEWEGTPVPRGRKIAIYNKIAGELASAFVSEDKSNTTIRFYSKGVLDEFELQFSDGEPPYCSPARVSIYLEKLNDTDLIQNPFRYS